MSRLGNYKDPDFPFKASLSWREILFIVFGLIVSLVVVSAIVLSIVDPAHAETREEMKARFEKVSKECAERADKILADDTWSRHWVIRSDCRRISPLRDDLIRCANERRALRLAAWCEHSWEMIGPGAALCPKCHSIAHFLGEQWQVVFAQGMWVGPEPWMYPDEYNLRDK